MKRPTLKETTRPLHTCADCAFATIDESQINRRVADGSPFMLKCQFTPWKKFFSDPACDRFVQKPYKQ